MTSNLGGSQAPYVNLLKYQCIILQCRLGEAGIKPTSLHHHLKVWSITFLAKRPTPLQMGAHCHCATRPRYRVPDILTSGQVWCRRALDASLFGLFLFNSLFGSQFCHPEGTDFHRWLISTCLLFSTTNWHPSVTTVSITSQYLRILPRIAGITPDYTRGGSRWKITLPMRELNCQGTHLQKEL